MALTRNSNQMGAVHDGIVKAPADALVFTTSVGSIAENMRGGDNMKRVLVSSIFAICLAATSGNAQPATRGGQPQAAAREDALDPTPVDPAVDPNVAMFINDW